MTNTPAREGLPELPAEVSAAFRVLTREDSTPEEIEARMFLMRHILASQPTPGAGEELMGLANEIDNIAHDNDSPAIANRLWEVSEALRVIALPLPQPSQYENCRWPVCGCAPDEREVCVKWDATPPPPSDAAQGVRPVRVDAVEGDSGIVAFAMSVTGEMMAALRRFSETAEDDESYDVPKEMMSRLAMFGLVTRGRPGWYYLTDFGRAALAAHKGEGNG